MSDLLDLLAKDWLAQSTTLLTLLGALASLLGLVFSFFGTAHDLRRKLGKTNETSVDSVLESDDLQLLGNHLDTVVGAFTIHEYATNPSAQKRVDELQRIQLFAD